MDNTTQHNTTQHNTTQHNTTQHNFFDQPLDERLLALKNSFPECFDRDGNFDLPKFKESLAITDSDEAMRNESYRFDWLGKSYARRLASMGVKSLIAPDTEHNSLNDNALSNNILIEGDNLEVLRHLKKAYARQVKMIYIDPPYNTKNDGFVYNDSKQLSKVELDLLVKDNIISENTRDRILQWEGKSSSHSAWLSFIYPRLKLGRDLLRDDGVIFISIDDNEQAQLKLLCDEIFGEENFVANFIWYNDGNIDQQSKIKTVHEYILCYSKNKELFKKPEVIDPNIEKNSKLFNDQIENSITKNGPANPISIVELPIGFPANFEKGEIQPHNDSFPHILDPIIVENYLLKTKVKLSSGWSSKRLLELFIANNCSYICDNENKQTEFKITKTGAIYIYKKRQENQGHVLSILRNMGTTKKTSNGLGKDNIIFSFPKPLELVKYLIQLSSTQSNDIILDFFAGSGTTGHAVMSLNAQDHANRRFILVQLDEALKADSEAYKAGYRTIANITKQRLIRASAKIKQENPLFTGDTGFKYYTLKPKASLFTNSDDELVFNPDATLAQQQQDTNALLTSYILHDGLELTQTINPVDLDGYTAYQCDSILYCINPLINQQTVTTLLSQIYSNKDFNVKKIVLCATTKHDPAIRLSLLEAVGLYNSRQGCQVDIEVRYL